MAEYQTFVQFEADLPDDAQFSDEGDLIRPGGQAIMAIVADMLGHAGLEVSEVEQHSWYGWSVCARRGKEAFWFLIQEPVPWLLVSEDRPSLLSRFRRRASSHPEVLRSLRAALDKDPRFTNIRWYTRKEYERDGAGNAPD